MTQLDTAIRDALQSLQHEGSARFDMAAYIAAFERSGQEKADQVIAAMSRTLPDATPVFVSVGGGDGAELERLMTRSQARSGFLIEGSRVLSEAARERFRRLPEGKSVSIFAGNVPSVLTEVLNEARNCIQSGHGDVLTVTCHAVLHELPDRSPSGFDAAAFFGQIFDDPEVTTWFTYREPGRQEKWPSTVLLRASCGPQSLRLLADAIRSRHSSFRQVEPQPHVLGDHLRLHRDLAMELLCKLFYLPDLRHEIEERSTSVDHAVYADLLGLAIGATAVDERRAMVTSSSAPTDSFVRLWQQYGVVVEEYSEGGRRLLPVPESQTRVIAYRRRPSDRTATPEPIEPTGNAQYLAVTADALRQGTLDLVTELLATQARAWIESPDRDAATQVLSDVVSSVPPHHEAHLWAHYLLSLVELFRGVNRTDPNNFTGPWVEHARGSGLALLFRAEATEFARKAGRLVESLEQIRVTTDDLERAVQDGRSSTKYVMGTANFLIANYLRAAGRYDLACQWLGRARGLFDSHVPSHRTELMHCEYALNVCRAFGAVLPHDAGIVVTEGIGETFARALVRLSYSHAAFRTDDLAVAQAYAIEAAQRFDQVGAEHHARRARVLSALLEAWRTRSTAPLSTIDTQLARIVEALRRGQGDEAYLVSWFMRSRISLVLGIIQFGFTEGRLPFPTTPFQLPQVLAGDDVTTLSWVDSEEVVGLSNFEGRLRERCRVPAAIRLPLVPD